MASLIDLTENLDGGVIKEVKKAGPDPNDKPWSGDKVYVHYTGTLEDGTKFDSSRDRGEKFSFNLGKSEVIKGWDLGVASMAKGELASFTIKSAYGYGDTGSPPRIPGGATLVFEVELFDFEGTDVSVKNDKSLIKRIVEAGEGFESPNSGATATIHLTGMVKGKTDAFVDKEITFTVGEGCEHGVPIGIETVLQKMKLKEKAHVDMDFYQAKDCEGLPKDTAGRLIFFVKLNAFERSKESWQLNGDQKLEQAAIFKAKGTEFFKQGKFELAANKYKKIIEFLEHEISLKGDKEAERQACVKAGRLNLSMCHIKLGEWLEARDLCDKIIDDNADQTKALFRRGESLIALNEHDLAKKDFERVLELEPENKAAKNKVAICAHQIKVHKQREKKTFANMFDRFAKEDKMKADEARKNMKPLEINEWGNKDNDGDPGIIPVDGDVQLNMNVEEAMQAADGAEL